MHQTTIPYGRQWVDEEDIAAVAEAMRGERLTTGPWIEKFESSLCDFVGGGAAAVLNSGTAALHAAYAAAGLGPGRRLVTSPLTFVATSNAALYLQARVEFADVDADTGCLDPKAVEALGLGQTDLVVPVDFAGHPADYAQFQALKARHGFTLGSDACHSLGATLHGRAVGTLTDFSCLSFHPVKPVTSAEGGAVLSPDAALVSRVRRFRTHGIERDPEEIVKEGAWFYAMKELGFNYRLSDLHAALGWSQMRRLSAFIRRRREIAAAYLEQLADLDSIELPVVATGAEPAWHLFVIRVREAARRRALFDRLQMLGIGVQVHYIPAYWHPYYAQLGYRRGLCPRAEDYADRAISLPIFPMLGAEDLARSVEAVRRAVRETL